MVATQNVPIEDLDARVDRMHKRDRIGALAFILALWITVLIFNTASILAMLRHYADDRGFIYGLDLKHLDEMRRQRRI